MKNQNQAQPLSALKASPNAWRLQSFPQKLCAQVDGRLLCTGLASLEALPQTVAVPCSLHPDSVRYAACRAFLKCPGLRDWALQRSYRLRLGGKRCPKSQRFCLALPVRYFSLAEGQAYIAFSVSGERVCVEQVWLLPAGACPPRRVTLQVRP